MSYASALEDKKFIPNVVIYFKGIYWAIRQPDSGLTIEADNLSVEQVTINPTKVDPAKAATTINTYSFKLLDKNYAVTTLFNGVTKFFQNEPVEIYVGRCGVDMPFSDYMKLPTTYISIVSKDNNSYNFNSTEAKERLNRPAFNEINKLEVDILDATTEIDAVELIDPLKYPASGLIKIEDEFISYASIDAVNNRFSGCIRGEENSFPVEHDAGSDIFLVSEVSGNPIDILLQCLVSKGGGGSYDVLFDGAAIDESLINVDSFEAIKDEFYTDQTYHFLLYGIDNILNFLEDEILYPNELRIISDNTSKLSLSVLNRQIFDVDAPEITNDTIKKQPAYNVDDSDITNVVSIEYDYLDATKKYRKVVTLQDDDSIADFGKRDTLKIKLKGISTVDDGAVLATNIAQRFLARFAYPKPEISFTTHMDKSLTQLGDKIKLVSTQLPNVDTGDLNFADTLEVIERGINWKTGDVKFKVAYTSFTGIKQCYLAPSDTVTSFTSESIANIGAGRGSLYRPGWKMRLYSNTFREYYSSQVNTITSIVGDVIHFEDDWTMNDNLLWDSPSGSGLLLQEDGSLIIQAEDTLFGQSVRIMFADYDDVTDQQRRYCFISDDGLAFSNGEKSYQVTI